jgi:chromosome segregation ATPase
LELIERDPAIYFNIKALFSKLQTPQTREDLFLLVTQAEAFLEQYSKHFQQLRNNSQAQNAKLKLKEKHFEQAKQRNNEVAQMKAESAGTFLQIATCDDNISHWKAEIRELEQKITEEEGKKEKLVSQAAAVSKARIEELAQDDIKQYSEGLAASNEADRLANENEVLRRKLAHTKEQYYHFCASRNAAQ